MMSVRRTEDGSVTIKNNNGGIVIGRMIKVSDDKRKDKFQQWVEHCAKLVTECSHTLKETEQYFFKQCDTLQLKPNDRRMENFKLGVIMNHCKDKLEHKASEFSFDMSDEEMEKWYIEDKAMRQEAMNTSTEQLGLNIRGYYLPHTERNVVFYEQAYQELQNSMKHTNGNPNQFEIQDICFFFEETTGCYESTGDVRSLMNQLTIFRGIRREDIERRTPRFLGYICALREIGDLPDFLEE